MSGANVGLAQEGGTQRGSSVVNPIVMAEENV